MKKEKGITLIALIITIVVLLILTGVTVMSAINGEGIFAKAREAKDKHNVAVKKEENEIKKQLEILNEDISTGEGEISLQTLTSSTPNGTPVTAPNDKGWNLANVNYGIAIGNNECVPVPKGFYYVGGDINTGIIISDNQEDENKAKKLKEEWSITEDPTQEKAHKSAEKLKGNQFVWIPDETKANYKGFYLGRYEAGTGENGDTVKFNHNKTFTTPRSGNAWETNDYIIGNYVSGKITSKANHIPYYHINNETAKKMNEKMYEGLDVGITSRGFSRAEWEKMTTYLAKDVGNAVYKADINNGSTWGNHLDTAIKSDRGKYQQTENGKSTEKWLDAKNYTTRNGNYDLLTTGSINQLQKKHLYNISGNLFEWEYDASYVSGSSFGSGYSNSASYRTSYSASHTYTLLGTRTVLIIK